MIFLLSVEHVPYTRKCVSVSGTRTVDKKVCICQWNTYRRQERAYLPVKHVHWTIKDLSARGKRTLDKKGFICQKRVYLPEDDTPFYFQMVLKFFKQRCF